MATVKKECELEDTESDTWLSYWANPQEEIKKEDIKQEQIVKNEILEDHLTPTAKDELINKELGVFSDECGSFGEQENEIDKTRKVIKEKSSVSKNKVLFKGHKSRLVSFGNAIVSDKVADMCEYQCPNCKEFFLSKCSLRQHFRKTSHVQKTSASTYNVYLSKIVAHNCLLCHKTILCERNTIKDHLKFNHQISIERYSVSINNESNIEEHRREKSLHMQKLTRDKQKTISSLGNNCEFKCMKCNYYSQSWRQLQLHNAKHKHGLGIPAKKLVKKASLYKCKVCNELVLCDRAIIRKHLGSHKLPLLAYTTQYYAANAQNLLCQYIVQLKAAVTHIPAIRSTPESFLEPNFLPIDQTTGNIGNLCFFKCPVCPKEDMSYSCLVRHYKIKHKSKHNYCFKKNVSLARYHRCQICAEIVLCDYTFIKYHVQRRHQISITEYSKKYILRNGFKIYPTFPVYLKNNQVFSSFNSEKNRIDDKDYTDNGLILPCMLSSESEDSD